MILSSLPRHIALALVLVAGWALQPALAEPASAPRMVLELFTSQGCSSCPPADALMGELAREPGIVVLSFPVDYWDYLGWHDTLASAAFTQRQRSYCKARGDRQVYTPQVVINGVTHAVGSERAAIEAAAGKGKATEALSVPVSLSAAGDRLTIAVGAAARGPHSGALWLFPIQRRHQVAIGRGENSGKMLTYTNVVRAIIRIGDWNGTAQSYDVPAETLKSGGADGYIVLLQAGTDKAPGMVLGAAQGPALTY